jgi:DNA-binding response OmpR family regulator
MTQQTILIVEDDKDIARSLTIRLKAAGYEVVNAFDAVLAMSAATKHRPDLAVLDVNMPGGDGFAVGQRLIDSATTAGVQLIYITASRRPGLREKAAELGAVGFFEKPYDASELVAAIDSALKSERAA